MRWSPPGKRLDWLTRRPIAHRGLHDLKNGIVENTATAFMRALDRGYAIECDVQITSDGEAVVFHDDTLDRLTDGRGPVNAKSARAIRSLAFKAGKDRIQTLGELLDQVAGSTPLVIELKSLWNRDEALTLRALDVLECYAGPYGLMSFDPDIVETLRERSPRTVRGIVTDRAIDSFYDMLPLMRRLELRYLTHMPRTLPHFISYRWMDLPFPPVTAFRAAGRPVISWTIRSPDATARARRYSDQITFEGFLA